MCLLNHRSINSPPYNYFHEKNELLLSFSHLSISPPPWPSILDLIGHPFRSSLAEASSFFAQVPKSFSFSSFDPHLNKGRKSLPSPILVFIRGRRTRGQTWPAPRKFLRRPRDLARRPQRKVYIFPGDLP